MKENSILFRIQEAEERRLRLYEDYKAEILDEDEYSQLKEHYIAEKQRLEHELQKQRQRALELEKRIKICDAQMERMRGILNQNEFDEELVHELIKKIYVGIHAISNDLFVYIFQLFLTSLLQPVFSFSDFMLRQQNL